MKCSTRLWTPDFHSHSTARVGFFVSASGVGVGGGGEREGERES